MTKIVPKRSHAHGDLNFFQLDMYTSLVGVAAVISLLVFDQ